MSAVVLKFRPPKVTGTQPRMDLSKEKRFFCMHCDTDRFVLLASGDVHCANCSSHIRNLFLHDSSAA